MLKLCLILLLSLVSNDTIRTNDLGIKAQKCSCSENSIFFSHDTRIFLKQQDTSFSQNILVPIRQLDTYAGLINAVLTSDNQILIFDNFLQQRYTVDLDALEIYNPKIFKLTTSSQLAVYDDFLSQLYIINFLNNKIENKIPLQNFSNIKSMDFDGMNIILLSDDKIFKITPLQQIKPVIQVPNAIGIAADADKLWVLTGKKLILITKNIQKHYILNRHYTQICGIYNNLPVIKAIDTELFQAITQN